MIRHPFRRLSFSALAALCCAIVAPNVLAQSGQPSATTINEDRAQRFYREGNAAFKREAWQEAEALYRRAWALSKSFDVAANLGETELELGKYREAAEYLSFSLRNAPPSSKPEQRRRTHESLKKAKKKVTTVTLFVNVEGASISIDGVPLDTAFVASELFLAPGKRRIEASADGYLTTRRTIEATEGATMSVRLAMPAAKAPEERSKAPGFVMGGFGVAALIAGGALFGVYEAKRAEIRDTAPRNDNGDPLCLKPPSTTGSETCDAARALGTEANVLGNAGIVSLAVGGAALVGGALYLAWPSQKHGATMQSSRIVPIFNGSGAGIVWRGVF